MPTPPAPDFVDRATFEARLATALAQAPSPEAGIFGPASMVWEVTRHLPVYALSTPLGGFMDTAHPWVAHGVAEHSTLFTDPRERARLTYLLLMRIVFADTASVERTSTVLFTRHSRIEGVLPEGAGRFGAGSSYAANEGDALLFVHVVFFWTRLALYERIVAPLSPEQRDRYVAESVRFGACFGIDPDLLPTTHAGLEETLARFTGDGSLAETPASVRTVDFLLSQVPRALRPVMVAFLVEVMPPTMATVLDLGPRSRRTKVLAGALFGWLRLTRRVLPESLRYVPAWLEARERLGGPTQPRLSRRLSERLRRENRPSPRR